MKALFLRCLFLLGACIAAPWAAADRLLQAEVLVFSQPGANGAPYWQDSRPFPVCHAVALREGAGAEDAFTDGSRCTRKTGFDAAFGGFAGISALALPAHAGKLESAGYTLLTGRRWQQVSANLSPVLLRGGKRTGERQELEGTLALNTGSAGTEASLELVLTKMDGDRPQFVTLSETRVIKPGELHYFDHPLFGVLLQTSLAP
jgi:hypothetical protein